jgi:hypothetical protein
MEALLGEQQFRGIEDPFTRGRRTRGTLGGPSSGSGDLPSRARVLRGHERF